MMTEKTLADQEAEKQTQIGADQQEGLASTAAEVCTNGTLLIGRSYGSFTLSETVLSCTEIGSRDQKLESVKCEYVLHGTMYPLGLESESEPIHKSVFVNVNEPMEVLYWFKVSFFAQNLGNFFTMRGDKRQSMRGEI